MSGHDDDLLHVLLSPTAGMLAQLQALTDAAAGIQSQEAGS